MSTGNGDGYRQQIVRHDNDVRVLKHIVLVNNIVDAKNEIYSGHKVIDTPNKTKQRKYLI